jgi:hypothetical protein
VFYGVFACWRCGCDGYLQSFRVNGQRVTFGGPGRGVASRCEMWGDDVVGVNRDESPSG